MDAAEIETELRDVRARLETLKSIAAELVMMFPEACDLFLVSPRTLERWIVDSSVGFPKPLKLDGVRCWLRPEIAAFKAKLGAAIKDSEKSRPTFSALETAYGTRIAHWLNAHGAVYR